MAHPSPVRTTLESASPTTPLPTGMDGRIMERLREPGQMPRDAELAQWALHPTEVVRWIAVCHHGADPRTLAAHTPEAAALRSRIVWEALARADAEGMIWTPLLDRIETTGLWAQVVRETRASGPAAGPDLVPSAEERVLPLAIWARYAATAETLAAALHAKSGCLLKTLARHARPEALVSEIVDEILTSIPLAEALAANPTLPRAAAHRIAQWAWETVDALVPGRDSAPGPESDAGLRGSIPSTLERMTGILTQVAQSPHGLPESLRPALATAATSERALSAYAALRALLSDSGTDAATLACLAPHVHACGAVALAAALALHPNLPKSEGDALWGGSVEADRRLLSAVLHQRGATPIAPRVFARMTIVAERDPIALAELVRHPQASAALIRSAALRLPATHPALAARQTVRWDPVVRSVLRASSDAAVLTGLLTDAPPVEWESLFARLLALTPHGALDVLSRGGPPPGTELSAETVRSGLVLSPDLRPYAETLITRFGLPEAV